MYYFGARKNNRKEKERKEKKNKKRKGEKKEEKGKKRKEKSNHEGDFRSSHTPIKLHHKSAYVLDLFSMTQFNFCVVAKLMEHKHIFLCCLLGSVLSASALGPGRTRAEGSLLTSRHSFTRSQVDRPEIGPLCTCRNYLLETALLRQHQWFDGEGPVCLLLGGEGPSSPARLVAETNIIVMARKFSGLVFSVEHR